MKRWMKYMWMLVGVLLVVGLVAAFGGWLSVYLTVVTPIAIFALGVLLQAAAYILADHQLFWSKPPALSAVVMTIGEVIKEIWVNLNKGDQATQDYYNLRKNQGYRIMKPNQGLVWVGWPWINKLAEWSWSKYDRYVEGGVRHAVSLRQQPFNFPVQLEPAERKKLEEAVETAKSTGQKLSPSQVDRLLALRKMMSRDKIELGIPLTILATVDDVQLFITHGENAKDKLLEIADHTLFTACQQLDFQSADSTPEALKLNDKLQQELQHYLNVCFGLEADPAVHRDPASQLPIDRIKGWGLRLDAVLVKDIQPPESFLAAMQAKTVALAERGAAVVKAEADASVVTISAAAKKAATIAIAEGQKQAEILESEGDKQAAITRAQGEKDAKTLLGEGEQNFLMQQIAAFDGEKKVTPAAVEAFLRKYQFQIYGENIQKSGRSVIMQMPGGEAGSGTALATAIVAMKELLAGDPSLANDPAKLAKKLVGGSNPESEKE